MTDRRAERSDTTPPSPAAPHGFRPVSRRRARLAAGAALAAVGIGGNVLLYTSLDDSVEVVQVATNVRAGQQLTAADLRTVEVDVDASVPVVTADRIDTLVGQYASVYIVAGTLMVDVLVQPEPLVAPGRSVVAVELRPTQVPTGVVERSRVQLIVVGADDSATYLADARVVSLTRGDDSGGPTSMSFEVEAADAPALAAAGDVRVVLLDPGDDPALPSPGPVATATTPPASTPVAPASTRAPSTSVARTDAPPTTGGVP